MRESPGYPNVSDTANHSLLDAFISIHVNAGGKGAETFCY
jgi:N-acetylmuramoyl-L-alanine amidase